MKFRWSTRLSRDLSLQHDDYLYQSYHLASSIDPATSSAAPPSVANAAELHIASRGFRQFQGVRSVPLDEPESSADPLDEVMLRRRSSRVLDHPLAFRSLSTVLRQALGVTAIVENSTFGVDQPLRSWPSAGGLYPLDTYVVATAVDRLASGVHHYNVVSEALEQLPSAPPRQILDDGFLYQDFVSRASVVVLLVAVFERTVAKYGERGYRLVLLDAGHAAENLLLAAESLRLPAVALAGFADAALSRHLGIDGIDEAVVHAVALGGRS